MSIVRRMAFLYFLVVTFIVSFPAAAIETGTGGDNEVIEREPVAELERMGKLLRSLPRFGVESKSTMRISLDSGRKVDLDATVTYKVVQPNRLYINVHNGRWNRDVYYDGAALTLWSRENNHFVQIENASDNLTALFVSAANQYGIEIPLADLFFWGTVHAPTSDLTAAVNLGAMILDGKQVKHYAYTQGKSDWQLWISRETGLPLKVVVSDRDIGGSVFSSILSWDTSTRFDDSTFVFDAPETASSVVLETLGPLFPSVDAEK